MLPYVDKETRQIGDINSGYWELAKYGMYGVANLPNGTGRRSFADAPYKIAAKSGTAQVFSYETYNASQLAEHLRDHKLMIAFAPYENPTVAVSIILENGGAGPSVGDITRQILDHIILGDNNTELPISRLHRVAQRNNPMTENNKKNHSGRVYISIHSLCSALLPYYATAHLLCGQQVGKIPI